MRKTSARGKQPKPSGEIRKAAPKAPDYLRVEGEATPQAQRGAFKMCHQVRPRHIYYCEPCVPETYAYEDLETGDDSGGVLPFDLWPSFDGTAIVETPEGNLTFTGGGDKKATNHAYQIADRREFAHLALPPMQSKRTFHGAVYFRGFVYVIGGVRDFSDTKECERLDLMERTWSAIPPIRQEMSMQSAIALESTSCLYVFGCRATPKTIFEFNVETMLWRKLSYSLPALSSQVPCFKIEGVHNQFFIIQESKLFSIDPHRGKVQQLKKLSGPMTCSNSQTYYSNGVIYSANEESITKLEVGRLELTL
jgi:hypothetical protein